ncbi:hypothetical protein VTH06DRAFT_5761 [Thermothelomyces fergusii]
MALASANEAADEERALVARLEAETLDQLRAHERQQRARAEADQSAAATLQSAREAILAALEASLPREGQTALTALAALALQMGDPLPTPSGLGAELISLSASAAALEQAISRVRVLTAHIAREAAATSQLAAELRPPSPGHHQPDDDDDGGDGDGGRNTDAADPANTTTTAATTTTISGGSTTAAGYHPPPTLALQNLALQRQIKSLSAQIPALRDKAAALARSQGGAAPSPSLARVREEEEAYLALLSLKQELDARVRAFAGLPHDTGLARRELEGLREELRRLEARRDEMFEGLVERETPRKPRR